jgi:hypothetical protein
LKKALGFFLVFLKKVVFAGENSKNLSFPGFYFKSNSMLQNIIAAWAPIDFQIF